MYPVPELGSVNVEPFGRTTTRWLVPLPGVQLTVAAVRSAATAVAVVASCVGKLASAPPLPPPLPPGLPGGRSVPDSAEIEQLLCRIKASGSLCSCQAAWPMRNPAQTVKTSY